MNAIVNHADIGGVSQNLNQYCADLTVTQFDRDESIKKVYSFKDAWPSEVSTIDLSYATGEEIERFTVTWTYQYWTSNTTDGINAA